MRLLSFLICILIGILANAQRYGSYNYIGRLQGGDHTKGFLFQTIHGLHFKSSYAGIGAGVDDYGIQSIPVFLNFTQKFLNDKSLFVSLNGGGQFVPAGDNIVIDEKQRNRFVISYEPSIGYLVKIKNKEQGVLFSGGYSFKHIRLKSPAPSFFTPGPGATETRYDIYDYRYNRLALKIGFLF